MQILRAIQFFFRQVSWRRRAAPPFSFEVDKRPTKFVYALVLTGFFYSKFQQRRESFRVVYRNQERRKPEYTIPIQIVRYSISTVLFLGLASAVSLFGDWCVEKLVVALSHVRAGWFEALLAWVRVFTAPDREFL